MSYQVDRFNGTFLTTVEDGAIDNTTDLRFIGKNYAGYGEVQNENFLHLLENFANTSQPPKAITGQIWYDSANKRIKFYDGIRFKALANSETSTSSPIDAITGDFWWDSSTKQLYVWSGTEYVLVGPEISPAFGFSGAEAVTVKGRPVGTPVGTLETEYTIVKLVVDGRTVYVVSATEFILSADTPITGFGTIKKGTTLINTPDNGITEDNHFYWGTASNALLFNGRPVTDFILSTNVEFSNVVRFADPGYTLGNDDDLWVHVENGSDLVFENQLNNEITFRITTPTPTDPVYNNIARIALTGVNPGETDTYSLGTPALKWNQVHAVTSYATTFSGTLVGNSTGIHTGNVVGNVTGNLTGDVVGNVTGNSDTATLADDSIRLGGLLAQLTLPSGDKTSIVQRDASGNIYANIMYGTASNADRLLINDAAVDTDPNYRSAKTTRTANTIAARDGSGDLLANFFRGTATSALYADLAEKYLADQDYEVGTVVSVGGEKEVTMSSAGDRAIGVVSGNPAYMMNDGLEGGTYVALKGRVPVKVQGIVKKGDSLIAHDHGLAISASADNRYLTFAIALTSNNHGTTDTVEAVIL